MSEKMRELQREKTQLEDRLAAIRKVLAIETDEKPAIIGHALLREAEIDPVFRAKLQDILRRHVKSAKDRDIVGLDDGERGDHRRTGD